MVRLARGEEKESFCVCLFRFFSSFRIYPHSPFTLPYLPSCLENSFCLSPPSPLWLARNSPNVATDKLCTKKGRYLGYLLLCKNDVTNVANSPFSRGWRPKKNFFLQQGRRREKEKKGETTFLHPRGEEEEGKFNYLPHLLWCPRGRVYDGGREGKVSAVSSLFFGARAILVSSCRSYSRDTVWIFARMRIWKDITCLVKHIASKLPILSYAHGWQCRSRDWAMRRWNWG